MADQDDDVMEKIVSNWEMFKKLCGSTSRAVPLQLMLEHFENRLIMCPASSRDEYHNSFPGGLVDHSLRVLKNFNTLQKTYNKNFKRESVIIASLFHDFGKAGDSDHDYYVDQDSDWHRKQGAKYKINPEIKFMTIPQRGLYMLQQFGVKLEFDEYIAILLNDGQYVAENKPYALKESVFSVMLHQADLMSTLAEKGRMSVLDEEHS